MVAVVLTGLLLLLARASEGGTVVSVAVCQHRGRNTKPSAAAKTDDGGSAINMDRAEIWQIEELTAVNISHAVPTGWLDVSDSFDSVMRLNFPCWARNVTEHALATVQMVGAQKDWPAHLGHIGGQIASAIDVDLTVHVCTLRDAMGTGRTCNITLAATEDHNRYLDLRVDLSTFGRFATTLSVRVVVAEDASKAVNVPLSFNVRVGMLQVDGVRCTQLPGTRKTSAWIRRGAARPLLAHQIQ
eukprot:SAG31_NODE_4003_length_3674_cov_7.299860_6_plen_243_part_00